MNKLKVKEFIIYAIAASIWWIVVLTPFMLLPQPKWFPLPIFVGMNFNQYLSWLVVEVIIVPPFGALSVYFIRWFGKFFGVKK